MRPIHPGRDGRTWGRNKKKRGKHKNKRDRPFIRDREGGGHLEKSTPEKGEEGVREKGRRGKFIFKGPTLVVVRREITRKDKETEIASFSSVAATVAA